MLWTIGNTVFVLFLKPFAPPGGDLWEPRHHILLQAVVHFLNKYILNKQYVLEVRLRILQMRQTFIHI